MSNDEWPKHPDGRNMKIGEMTREQARAVAKRACRKLQNDPNFIRSLQAILEQEPSRPN